PPWVGTSESTSRTPAPASTSARARFEPMKPSPPVISTRLPPKYAATSGSGTRELSQGRSQAERARREHGRTREPALATPVSTGDHVHGLAPRERVEEL